MDEIYLDNAATTALDPAVLDAMMPWLKKGYGNASSAHTQGRAARLMVETARKQIAALLNCAPRSILFTSGGTESANTAIRTAVRGYKVSSIITSSIEHKCVLSTVKAYSNHSAASLVYLDIHPDGVPSLKELDEQLELSRGTSLVCLMHANNETGAMIRLKEAADICHKHKAIFFSDTVPTIGHVPIDLSETKVSMCSASAHKFHGPKGVGFLYVREGVSLAPLIHGGSQELGYRGGTENVAGIAGMSAALEIASKNLERDRSLIAGLKTSLARELEKMGAVVNGATDPDSSLHTILNVRFTETDRTQQLLMQLDMAGVYASGGSACNAGNGGASHVMEAMGLSDHINIRFSFSKFNTQKEIDTCAGLIRQLVESKQIMIG